MGCGSSTTRREWDPHLGCPHPAGQCVPVGPVLKHVETLTAGGACPAWICAAAKVYGSTIDRLRRQRCTRRSLAEAILATDLTAVLDQAPPGTFIPAIGTHRRIGAMLAMGHRHADIQETMRRLGYTARSDNAMSRNQVTRETARAVAAAYHLLWNVRGPSDLSARRALAAGNLPPMAWDDDTIDDPHAVPDMTAVRRDKPRKRNPVVLEDVCWILRAGSTIEQAASRLDVTEEGILKAAATRGTPQEQAIVMRAWQETKDIRDGMRQDGAA